MVRSASSLLTAACVILSWPAQYAAAQLEAHGTQRVAIARIEFEGHVPEGVQDLFSQRLVEGLSAARFEVLRGRDVEQQLHDSQPALVGCRDASCYPALASAISVSYLIAAKVSESDKTYVMQMELINGRTGAVLAGNRERCETCGVEEAGEKMGLAASALRERLESLSRAPARFVVRSRPAGARASVDSNDIGYTPLDVDLSGGNHHLRLSLAGYETVDRPFTVVGGVDETLNLDMVALPSKFPYRAVGIGALVGGVLLMSAGLWALATDGKEKSCSAEDQDINHHCAKLWDSKWLGAVLLGTGTAAAGLGGVFLYLAPTSTGSTRAGVGINRSF